jgi:hypothetical protein
VTRLGEVVKGEYLPIYGSLTAPSGSTVTVSGTPTFTLRTRPTDPTSAPAVVSGFDGASATTQIAGPAQTVTAVYELDLTNVSAGRWYTAEVYLIGVGSDGRTRKRKNLTEFFLKAPGVA